MAGTEDFFLSQQRQLGCRIPFCGNDQDIGNGRSSNTPDDDEYAAALAKAMNKLSVAERNRIQDEMHGAQKPQEETPELVNKSIEELDTALACLPRSVRNALDRAMFLRPELKTDTKFKLMFLRADNYDVSMAAERIATYFTTKLSLFGEDKLVKKLEISDLEQQDIKILTSGMFLKLPHDSIGRPIMCVNFSKIDLSDQDAMVRASWFDVMNACENEVGQEKSFVNICFLPGRLDDLPEPINRWVDHFSRMEKVVRSVPLKCACSHFCIGDPRLQFLITKLHKIFAVGRGNSFSVRLKCHFGSPVEMAYSLMTFGIPFCSFMVNRDEQKRLLNLYIMEIMKKNNSERDSQMQREARSGVIIYPQPQDALIGRGHPYHSFAGTRRLLRIVDSLLEQHSRSIERFERTCIAMEVVKRIQDQKGRFLQRTDVGWKVIDDVEARSKVTNIFRYKKNLLEGNQKQSNNSKRRRLQK